MKERSYSEAVVQGQREKAQIDERILPKSNRAFAVSSFFTRDIIDPFMPSSFEQHLQNGTELILNSRPTSGTAAPASARLSASMI